MTPEFRRRNSGVVPPAESDLEQRVLTPIPTPPEARPRNFRAAKITRSSVAASDPTPSDLPNSHLPPIFWQRENSHHRPRRARSPLFGDDDHEAAEVAEEGGGGGAALGGGEGVADEGDVVDGGERREDAD